MKLFSALFSVWMLTNVSYASLITNAINGVGPNNATKPYLCLEDANGKLTLALAPDQSGDANLASGYAEYAQGHLRFEGCEDKNQDLGFVTIAIGSQIATPLITSYIPPNGIHAAYINANINAQGKLTGNIVYTPISANFNLTPAKPSQSLMFTGINLSGLEFGQILLPSVVPNLSQADIETPYSDLTDIQAFIDKGINTVRIPISWTFLQWNGPGRMIINQEYYTNYIKPLLETLTAAKIYTILDLHCNMHYNIYGQKPETCPKYGYCHSGGTLILDPSAYTYVWGQLWQQIQQDPDIHPDYLLFNLINAPIHAPDDTVFTIQTTLINQLRLHGFKGYILVEGNAGSQLHNWAHHQWIGQDGQTYTNATLFTRANFLQKGVTDLSKILISVHQYFDEGYQGIQQKCLPDVSTTGPNGFNLAAFTQYLQDNQLKAMVTDFGVGKDAHTCMQPLSQFLNYLEDHAAGENSHGFVGWALWGAGHAWGKYPLHITPNSYVLKIAKQPR